MAVGLTHDEYKEKLKVENPTLDMGVSVYTNGRARLDMTCTVCKHTWSPPAAVLTGVNKTGCPQCGKMKKKKGPRISVTEWWERSRVKHNDKFTCDLSQYVDQNTILNINCPVHGLFPQKPVYHLHGKGCAKCGTMSLAPRTNASNVVARIEKEFPNMFNTSKVEYKGQYTDIILGCVKHGDFPIRPKSLFQGVGCPGCKVASNVMSNDTFITKAKNIHGTTYGYNDVDMQGSKTKVNIRCKIHGIFSQLPGTHLDGHGCKQCNNHGLTQAEFEIRARQLHPELIIDERSIYIRGDLPIIVGCKSHGDFQKRADELLRVNLDQRGPNGCPICTASAAEKQMFEMLTVLKIPFKSEFKLPNSKYRYDYYLTDLDILIELHGEQHFKPVKFWGGDKGYEQQVKSDKEKVELARAYDVPMITINYVDFHNLEKVFLTELNKHYRYLIDGVGYKSFLALCKDKRLSLDATSDKYDDFKTINIKL